MPSTWDEIVREAQIEGGQSTLGKYRGQSGLNLVPGLGRETLGKDLNGHQEKSVKTSWHLYCGVGNVATEDKGDISEWSLNPIQLMQLINS